MTSEPLLLDLKPDAKTVAVHKSIMVPLSTEGILRLGELPYVQLGVLRKRNLTCRRHGAKCDVTPRITVGLRRAAVSLHGAPDNHQFWGPSRFGPSSNRCHQITSPPPPSKTHRVSATIKYNIFSTSVVLLYWLLTTRLIHARCTSCDKVIFLWH